MTPWNASPTSAVPTSWNGTSTTESRESRALATELMTSGVVFQKNVKTTPEVVL